MLIGNSRRFVLISLVGRMFVFCTGIVSLWFIVVNFAAGLGLLERWHLSLMVVCCTSQVFFYRDMATFVPLWESTTPLLSLAQIVGLSMCASTYLLFPDASWLIVTSLLIMATILSFQMGQLVIGGMRALRQPAEAQKRRAKLAEYRTSDPSARRIKLDEHEASEDREWSLKV